MFKFSDMKLGSIENVMRLLGIVLRKNVSAALKCISGAAGSGLSLSKLILTK
jgi:hypothetical protein